MGKVGGIVGFLDKILNERAGLHEALSGRKTQAEVLGLKLLEAFEEPRFEGLA